MTIGKQRSGAILLGLVALALLGCSGSDDDSEEEYAYSDESADEDGGGYDGYTYEEIERAEFDEDAARDVATDELSSETYDSVGQPYGCTDDCSGHDAGFAWAAEGNEDGGYSNSQSFDEGQISYEEAVEERVEEMREEYDAGEVPY